MRTRFMLAMVVTLGLTGCSDESSSTADQPVMANKPAPKASADELLQGQAVYVNSCLLCHQHDGSGVPGMQPALTNNDAVTGAPERLIEIVLKGVGSSEHAVPASGEYAMVMPGSATLDDEQIAQLLTYIRQTFADSGPIKPEQVAAVRAKME